MLKLLRDAKEQIEGSAELSSRMEAVEATVDKIDAELEVLKEQNRLMIQRTTLGFRDQFYLKLGVSILMPRANTFASGTETGIGALAGAGVYLGRHNVIETSFEWDLYPSAVLRYRYEFQSTQPAITWGPLVGIKARLLNEKPLDGFISDPAELKPSYWMVGGMVGFPIARSLFSVELVYLTNQQSIVCVNGAFHFFW